MNEPLGPGVKLIIGRRLMKGLGESFFTMQYIIKSTTTRTQGWQSDCWNWAKANLPFKLYGVESQHLAFCKTLAKACRCQFYSRQFRDEAVATFEPSLCPG